MKSLVTAVVICLAIPCIAQTASNTARTKPLTQLEQTLIDQSEAVARAQKAKDLETLRRLLTDDFERVGSEGGLHDKSDILEDVREGTLEDYRLYDFHLLPVDENVAIVTYNAVIQMPEEDEGPAPRYQHFSDVWVKQGDQWRLRFQQSTAKRSID
ncbi:MAG TPA: nuclear transport factor 2 family protein [Terriglobales bacterium]|nr:nuclear transport factor 2 family protein [Terriglobales bacterium]